jgi:mRNA-degrading endonuclease RelE of RelBE toxin-antitoxin system
VVIVEYGLEFKKNFKKIKDNRKKEQIIKQIIKIKDNPEIGKPMRYTRKGTRELYVCPYRISYKYIAEENLILFLTIYHKDVQ